jgi:hypothetical protein
MDEHFQLHRRLTADRANLINRKLARQHDALDAQPLGRADALAAGKRHLRRRMHCQVRTHRAQ